MVRLQQAREDHGWSRQELAHHSGVSLQTIHNIENDLRKPKPETLRKLAATMRVDIREITRGREVMPGIYGDLPPGVLGVLQMQESLKNSR